MRPQPYPHTEDYSLKQGREREKGAEEMIETRLTAIPCLMIRDPGGCSVATGGLLRK